MSDIAISKLDAARRQIITAIRLYFNNGDIVSMHTLAAAAFKITQNICDSNPDLPDSMTDWVEELVTPEYKSLFWREMHKTANFFKHAKNDPDAVHKFSPGQSENILFLAVNQYARLTNDQSAEVRAFQIWYATHHPKAFAMSAKAVQLGLDLYGNDRQTYWREFMPLLQTQIDQGLTGYTSYPKKG